MRIVYIIMAVCATAMRSFSYAKDACTITDFSEIDTYVPICTSLIIDAITVPAGKTLKLDLKDDTTLTFQGTTKFDHYEWDGPLVIVKGKNITVRGASGSILDGQGPLYWDGLGGSGTTKPYFFRVTATHGSRFENITLLNCPHHCALVDGSNGVTLSGWNIDCSLGDTEGGHNTDGFDVFSSDNVVIEDSIVKNQDDCVAVNQGSNMLFSRLTCYGTHGLSLSVGFNKTYEYENTVTNVTFSDCTVHDSANAIHIKTHNDGGPGSISDVTYKNITFSGVTNYAISIQEDYANGGSTGTAIGNVPITNLKMIDIKGTLRGTKSMPVYIFCGENGCANWTWSGVSISGGHKSSSCNFKPTGFTC